MKKRFNIKIMGHDISVVSDKGDDHVAKIVRYVNEKAEEIEKNSKDVTTLGIAMMVTLNITEELFKVTEEQEKLCNQYESIAENLINYIDKTEMDVMIPCDVRD